MKANLVQFFGAALIVLFLFSIWPPLVLLSSGVFLLAYGLSIEKPSQATDVTNGLA